MAEEKTFAASLGIEAFTAEELGATLSGPYEAIPEDLLEAYQSMCDNVKNAVAERVAANVQRGQTAGPEIGTRFGFYEVVDIMTISPWKPGLSPPFVNIPHKLVASGELIVHFALLFVNPLPGPGGTPTGQMQLGGHGYRITFNLLNVTTATTLGSPSWTGVFGPLAPVVSVWPLPVTWVTGGPNPHLLELNVTFDCSDPAQPYAAFSTQWWDIDSDPGFPWPDPGGPRRLLPLRYLVHPE
jgi:hypothetical protein